MQSLAEEPARAASQTHVQVPHKRSVQQLPPSSPEQSPVIDHGRNKDTTASVFLSAGLGPCSSRTPTHSRAQPSEGNRTTHRDAERHLPASDNGKGSQRCRQRFSPGEPRSCSASRALPTPPARPLSVLTHGEQQRSGPGAPAPLQPRGAGGPRARSLFTARRPPPRPLRQRRPRPARAPHRAPPHPWPAPRWSSQCRWCRGCPHSGSAPWRSG